MITPFPKQVEIVDQMVADLKARQYSFQVIGMRSGKTAMAYMLAARKDYNLVVMLGNEPTASRKHLGDMLCHNLGVSPTVRIEYSTQYIMHELVGDALVVMNEALFTRGSYEQFKTLREIGCHVVVLTSLGPEFEDDPRWKELEWRSYATWHVNPNLGRDSELMKKMFAENPEKAARDYGALTL